jgi:hypothetical protein
MENSSDQNIKMEKWKNLFMLQLQDIFNAVSSADWILLHLKKKIVGFLFSQKIMKIVYENLKHSFWIFQGNFPPKNPPFHFSQIIQIK